MYLRRHLKVHRKDHHSQLVKPHQVAKVTKLVVLPMPKVNNLAVVPIHKHNQTQILPHYNMQMAQLHQIQSHLHKVPHNLRVPVVQVQQIQTQMQ